MISGRFFYFQEARDKKTTQQPRRRHGGFRPDRDRRVQAARPARVRPSCPPCVRSNNRRQQRRRRRRRASRTRGVRANARFISQLACTKANLNIEWLKRFEGGVASACAVAAPPLRLRSASAPPPLRLRSASTAPLASCSPRSLRYLPRPSPSRARRRETHFLSLSTLECAESAAPAPVNPHRMHAWAVTWRAFRLSIRVRSTFDQGAINLRSG